MSRIQELSTIISSNTTLINDYLVSRSLPTPSFSADVTPGLLNAAEIANARRELLDATDELHALILGPVGLLTTPSHNFLISLQAIYRFNLAAHVPLNEHGSASFEAIANASGLSESHTQRILRHAMTYHIFQEPRKGVVQHTTASKILATSPLMHQWVGMVCEEMWPSAAATVEALAKWPHSEEPTHTGFNLANNTQSHVFEELARFPTRAKRYADAMSWFNTGPGLETSHIVDAFDWASVGSGTIVDVGGSYGTVGIAISQRFPRLHCIVQDRAEVIAEGISRLPPGISNVTFMAHDFFTPQTVMGAQVYYFRWIFHDWSDKYAIRILQALVPALSPGSKILISEYVLPDVGQVPPYQERSFRGFDLAMLEFHNGKERDPDDWAKLFSDADTGFKFTGARQLLNSRLGLVEAVWEGI